MSLRVPQDSLLKSDTAHMNFLRDLAALVADNAVTNTMLAQAPALTVKGNATNATANETDIAAAAASGAVLRETGGALGFGTIATAGIGANQVTNAKLAQMAANTIKLNNTAGLADPVDATVAQFQTMVTYPGRLVSFQVLTSGTTYTRPVGVTSILVEGQGGGGGGGGVVVSAVGAITVAAGGGGGTYGRRFYSVAPASGTYAIGAAGTAGAVTGAVAGNGGSTTFTDGTTLLTLPGGAGAPTDSLSTVSGTAAGTSLGGAGGAAATNSNLTSRGEPGGGAMRLSGAVSASGAGGAGLFGGQGQGRVQGNPGADALANSGAGGGGAISSNSSAAVVGGNGGSGWLIVWEFA